MEGVECRSGPFSSFPFQLLLLPSPRSLILPSSPPDHLLSPPFSSIPYPPFSSLSLPSARPLLLDPFSSIPSPSSPRSLLLDPFSSIPYPSFPRSLLLDPFSSINPFSSLLLPSPSFSSVLQVHWPQPYQYNLFGRKVEGYEIRAGAKLRHIKIKTRE